jgi:hypothetical protein
MPMRSLLAQASADQDHAYEDPHEG